MSNRSRIGFYVVIGSLTFTPCRAGDPQATPGSLQPRQASPSASNSGAAFKVKIADSTPEDALRTFMLAIMAQDGVAVRTLAVPNPELDLLLQREPAPKAVIEDARAQFARLPIKRLRAGDTVSLPQGKSYVVAASEVGGDRVVLLPAGSKVPTRVKMINGRWKVAAEPMIAARKAALASQKQAEAKQAARKG
jgi:hypothetical protein